MKNIDFATFLRDLADDMENWAKVAEALAAISPQSEVPAGLVEQFADGRVPVKQPSAESGRRNSADTTRGEEGRRPDREDKQ